ncbi:cytochrome b/b6 domain-containing protein [uncultured Kordia sp.]|uniref:cytochrome b n=1 Tax=uncultured Kordia sp. TaxID=507699 RepID=UPI002627F933|nr:cytochrome b/b6 domain-containing protein [uncultured Kordia sp.]
MFKNDLTKKFSSGTIITHWLTAFLILLLFPMGKYMAGLETSEKMGFIKIHAVLGIIVFIMTIIRSWLFFKSPRPEDLKTGSNFNDKLVIWIHNAFYILLFGISISGIGTMILGGYGDALMNDNANLILNKDEIMPLKGHEIMSVIMMVLLVMHILGVIKHYILTKENTLRRIFW